MVDLVESKFGFYQKIYHVGHKQAKKKKRVVEILVELRRFYQNFYQTKFYHRRHKKYPKALRVLRSWNGIVNK